MYKIRKNKVELILIYFIFDLPRIKEQSFVQQI